MCVCVCRVNVLCNDQLLQYIEANQFLDSPEYESTSRIDEKFKVRVPPGNNISEGD